MTEGSTSSYTTMILQGEQPQPLVDLRENDDQDNDDHDLDPVSGPRVLSSIELAKNPGVSWFYNLDVFEFDLSVDVVHGYPHDAHDLAQFINQPKFPELLHRFLWELLKPDSPISPEEIPIDECPRFGCRISVYHSAVARFYAPSDLCGTGGMYHERIWSTPNWHGESSGK